MWTSAAKIEVIIHPEISLSNLSRKLDTKIGCLCRLFSFGFLEQINETRRLYWELPLYQCSSSAQFILNSIQLSFRLLRSRNACSCITCMVWKRWVRSSVRYFTISLWHYIRKKWFCSKNTIKNNFNRQSYIYFSRIFRTAISYYLSTL